MNRRGFFRQVFQGAMFAAAVVYAPSLLAPIQPVRRKLRAVWTMESAKDLYAAYGLDENGEPCSTIDRERTYKDLLAEFDKAANEIYRRTVDEPCYVLADPRKL